MSEGVYTQNTKKMVRHEGLYYAVDLLTNNRSSSVCVNRKYLRDIYDFIISNEGSSNGVEAEKIDINYIRKWEELHDSYVRTKRPSELKVCYLSGPEPENDFDELISLGIHPQNIWAFENNNTTYLKAIENFNNRKYPQPKIVKGKIENFFMDIPKSFDIVYIDACGALASGQHVLRIISALLKYHRLESLGVIITNFAEPDIRKSDILDDYSNLIGKYLNYKNDLFNGNKKVFNNLQDAEEAISHSIEKVKGNFQYYYGEFITRLLMDLSSTIVPSQRFANSNFVNHFINNNQGNHIREMINTNFEKYNSIEGNSVLQFIMFEQIFYLDKKKNKRIKMLLNDLSGTGGGNQFNLFDSLLLLNEVRVNDDILLEDVKKIKIEFNECNYHQFLDKPNSNLFFDLIINQLSYPLHYNTEKIKRYMYKSKKTNMFTDIFILDEARYLYEWLPNMHLIQNAFDDISWQYTFRFALDGLIKQRINYNTDYFYQGSVVSKKNNNFCNKKLSERITIKG